MSVASDNKVEEKVYYLRAFRFMWRFFRPIFRPVWWILIFLVISTCIALVEPNIYRLVIDAMTVKVGQAGINFGYIFWLLMIWTGVSLLNLIFFSVYRLTFAYRLPRVDKSYHKQAFEVFLNLDVSKHLSKKSGEQLKKIDRANDALWGNSIFLAEEFIPSWLTLISMLILGFVVSWPMALVTLVMVPVYVWIFLYGRRRTDKLQGAVMREFEDFWGNTSDMAANIMAVKSFAKEDYHLGKILKQIGGISQKQSKISLRWGMLSTAGYMLGLFNRLIIFCGGVYLVSINVVSLGTVIMFLSISGSIYNPLQNLGGALRQLQKQCGYLNAAEKLFNEVNKVVDASDAKKLKVVGGVIEFKNASFQYEKLKIIRGLSFQVKPGQMTALVGHSGAGKSTLASLMLRFYDLNSGAILIDGQDLRSVTMKSLRENIGLVMQDNSMFNETIFNNIAYAKPGSKRAEVERAAKLANIHDFIVSQPKGYQTMVGERGLKLSGGQKQRVAIARVILKDPPILILDEATSALDSVSEKVVQEALEQVMKGRTSIVIAHRLSTVRRADQIVVLDKGRLAQKGTHAQLMRKKGIYKELVDLQVEGLLAK